MTSPGKADLIVKALVGGGQHLHDFLPGQDRRAAVGRLVASKLHWNGPGHWCGVTRDGIGDWGGQWSEARLRERRADAVTFVTWDEVLAVVERGCSGGHRRAYQAAYDEWFAGVRAAWAGRKPGEFPSPAAPDSSAIHATAAALIRHGCEQPLVQEVLF